MCDKNGAYTVSILKEWILKWTNFKATQVKCGARNEAPDGCLQYHTTLSGRFQTFNFAEATTPQHLASQK